MDSCQFFEHFVIVYRLGQHSLSAKLVFWPAGGIAGQKHEGKAFSETRAGAPARTVSQDNDLEM